MKNASKKQIVNTIKKDNGTRKVKKVTQAFTAIVKEVDDPRVRTDSIHYPLAEILFIALSAVISAAVWSGKLGHTASFGGGIDAKGER